jgi:putative membrane protein
MLLVAPLAALTTILIVQSAVFLGLMLLFHWRPVKMALIPAPVKRQRASRLAREQFFGRGLHLTDNHNAILLFVSVAERYVEIIADSGIHARVADPCWQDIVADFTARVGRGQIADGFLCAIEACSARLAEHYPATAERSNRLPDYLIEID